MGWEVSAPWDLDLLRCSSVAVSVACDRKALSFQRFEQVLLDVVGIIVRVFVRLQVNRYAFGPVLCCLSPLRDQVVRVLAVHALD